MFNAFKKRYHEVKASAAPAMTKAVEVVKIAAEEAVVASKKGAQYIWSLVKAAAARIKAWYDRAKLELIAVSSGIGYEIKEIGNDIHGWALRNSADWRNKNILELIQGVAMAFWNVGKQVLAVAIVAPVFIISAVSSVIWKGIFGRSFKQAVVAVVALALVVSAIPGLDAWVSASIVNAIAYSATVGIVYMFGLKGIISFLNLYAYRPVVTAVLTVLAWIEDFLASAIASVKNQLKAKEKFPLALVS